MARLVHQLIPKEFHGDFLPGKVDEIKLQNNQVEINDLST